MIARYDLSQDINSHDFYHWAIVVAAMGACEIVYDLSKGFRPSGWPDDQSVERYRTIVRPGAALAGLPSREGIDGTHIPGLYKLKNAHKWALANPNASLPRLKSILPPKNVRYTVTLREQVLVDLHRNSNLQAWMKFADKIGAYVIRDYIVEPIDLYERFALYAGAEMNFGVDNGPMSICQMSPYPCMAFKYHCNQQYLERCGVTFGGKFAWCGRDQLMYWEDDSLQNIWQRFNEWQARRAA
jgi:hypothetical protein